MNIRKSFALLGAIAAFALLSVAPLQAASIVNLVPGVINEWEDRDWEIAFGPDGEQLGLGDRLVPGSLFLGALRIEAWGAPDPSFPGTYLPGGGEPTVTALFAIRVASVVDANGQTAIYFEPLGTTDWSGTFGLTLPTPTDENTMLILWDDVLRGSATAEPGETLQEAINNHVGTNKVYEFGFGGTQETFDVNEGAVVVGQGVTTDRGEFFVAEGPEGIDALGFALDELITALNLSALWTGGGAPELVPHGFLAGQPVEDAAQRAGVSFTNWNDLQAVATIDLVDGLGPFPIRTDASLYVRPADAPNPIPEPSSIVLWGIGALGLGLAAARRRKQALAS